MNKKGFTLIEIIIVLGLVTSIGIISIITASKNENSQLSKINNRIIESAKVYLENEKDINGNIYRNAINKGGQGLILPLETLLDLGYITQQDFDYINLNVETDNKYIVAGYKSKEDCGNGNIEVNVNWNESEVINTPLYLCEYEEGGDPITKEKTMLNVLLNDNNLKLNIPNLDNYLDTDKGLYILPDDDGFSFYFYGKVENNYLKYDDKIWRIIRVNGNGSTRIALDDVIPYKLEKGEIESYKKNNYGAKESEVISSGEGYFGTYDKLIKCFFTGENNRYTCFYDLENNDIEYKTNYYGIINEIIITENAMSKAIVPNNFEPDKSDSLYASNKYNILKNYYNSEIENKDKIKKDDKYYINNEYLFEQRNFKNEDRDSPREFTTPIQTITYKELKYSGESNSFLTAVDKNFYLSDYKSEKNNFYYDLNNNEIASIVDFSSQKINNGNQPVTLYYADKNSIATSIYRYNEFNVYGFRPVINLIESTCYKGNGTIDNPYEVIECNSV